MHSRKQVRDPRCVPGLRSACEHCGKGKDDFALHFCSRRHTVSGTFSAATPLLCQPNSGQPGVPFTPASARLGSLFSRALMKGCFWVFGGNRPRYSVTTMFSVAGSAAGSSKVGVGAAATVRYSFDDIITTAGTYRYFVVPYDVESGQEGRASLALVENR